MECSFQNTIDTRQSKLSLQELPDEILVFILAAVRQLNIGDLTTTLRVCRRWHEIGNRLIWRRAVLTRRNISPFTENVSKWQRRSHLSQRIQSLTVNIGHEIPRNRTSSDHVTGMRDLPLLLPGMSNLKTFSLRIEASPSAPWTAAHTTDEMILNLVRCLPYSVQHLAIDSSTVYFRKRTGDTCLCGAIAARIEGLRSLRLAWPRICSKLLSRSSSTLEYLVINACKLDLRPGIRECRVADEWGSMSWDELQQQANTISANTIQAFLSEIWQPGFIRSLFPRIYNLVVVEPYHFAHSSNYDWFLLNVHVIVAHPGTEQHELQLLTTSYPIWVTGIFSDLDPLSAQNILRRCVHSVIDGSSKNTEHDCSTSDIVGTPRAIWDMLEGDAGWTTTETGHRQPRHIPCPAEECLLRETLRSKPQFEKFYQNHRSQVLTRYKERHGVHASNPDAYYVGTWLAIQRFHLRHHVKAKRVGADYLWYRERDLGHSMLWGRTFEGGIRDHLYELHKDKFTTVAEELERFQSCYTIDGMESQLEDF